MVFLDGTIVHVALPTLAKELGGDFSTLQWTIDAYLLVLGALLLVGGSLGDLYGRRRVFVVGALGFSVASVACGMATSMSALIGARAVQGLFGALLVPGSLAILSSSFSARDRGDAIGIWSAGSAVTTALGPTLGGWLVQSASWRWAFFLNLPLGIVAAALASRAVPESRDSGKRRPDSLGAVLVAFGLGGLIFALIEGPSLGFDSPAVIVALGLAALGLPLFIAWELRTTDPMVPLGLFRHRSFAAANAITAAVYFSVGGAIFLLILQLQNELGYSPLQAGLSLTPMTLLMVLLSRWSGRQAEGSGARVLLVAGPSFAAVGLWLLGDVARGTPFLTGVLPGLVLFGLGLSLLVAPLTATVFAAVEESQSGIASGINNAVSRVSGLMAVALLPWLAGIDPTDLAAFPAGYGSAMRWAAGSCALGAVIAGLGLPSMPESKARTRE